MPVPDGYIGAIPETPKPTDPQLGGQVFGASVASVDFSAGFLLDDTMPNVNQGPTNTCVGQAYSYLHAFLKGIPFSVRDLYSRIYLPNGGASIQAGGYELTTNGQATESECPDPVPETEEAMRVGSTSVNERQYLEASSVYIPNDISSIAAACRQYSGCVFGITGSNPGFYDMLDPRPPMQGEVTWGHCVWVKGYCVRNGARALICKSSLPEAPMHYITEDFFTSGDTFSGMAIIPNKTMQIKTQNLNGELRIVLEASTPDQWAALCAVYGLDPNVGQEQVVLKS